MKKWLNLFLIGLLAVTASAAAADPHVFVPLHWTLGTVTAPQGVTANGHTVVFYRGTNTTDTITATVANGKYVINTYNNNNIPINYTDKYYVAVQKGTDNYGADPVELTFSAGEGFKEVNLTLQADQSPLPTTGNITFISPAGGENWETNTTQNITWIAPDLISNVNIALSLDNGKSYSSIATTANSGKYPWVVPSPASTQAKIKISDANDATVFAESNLFTIAEPPLTGGPVLQLTLLLDGYYNFASNSQTSTTIEVQLRDTGNANYNIIKSAIFSLNQTNNTVAYNGVGADVAGGNYYIVVKHANHLPIITKLPVALSTNQTATLDFSDPAFSLELGNPDAMIVMAGKKLLRGGEYKTDKLITVDDWDKWKDAYGSDPSKSNWNAQSDGNGDGKVSVDDWDIWKDNYGSKSFVP